MAAESEAEKDAYEALSRELKGEYPGHLPVLSERVKRLAGLPREKRDAAVLGVSVRAQRELASCWVGAEVPPLLGVCGDPSVACRPCPGQPGWQHLGATYPGGTEVFGECLLPLPPRGANGSCGGHEMPSVRKGPGGGPPQACCLSPRSTLRSPPTSTPSYPPPNPAHPQGIMAASDDVIAAIDQVGRAMSLCEKTCVLWLARPGITARMSRASCACLAAYLALGEVVR